MPQNIEAFVKTLESEGVDAGKKASEKIQADARQQAEKIIADGRAAADKIIAQAKAEAEKIKIRMNSSLELAARDAISMLREQLSRQLTSLLSWHVENALGKEDTLAKILCEVIPAYARADADKKLTAQLNVPENMKAGLLQGAIGELAESLRNKNTQIDVKHNLAEAGFEYKIESSTVEVNKESVTALLMEMLDPQLAQFLEKGNNTGN